MEELKKPFLSLNQIVGKHLICNKDICVNNASSLTDDAWKTLTNLAKTRSSLILPIDHQYYQYKLVHVIIAESKTAFCKQNHSGNCCPAFGRHPLIDKLKIKNEGNKPGTEAVAAVLRSLFFIRSIFGEPKI